MKRNLLLTIGTAVLFLHCMAQSHATVLITSDPGTPTPGLAGFRTYKLTATSDVAGEYIAVVDFMGDPENNDPATARGFFGTMNQLEAGGPGTTVFNNFNIFFPNNGIADSQFSVSSSDVIAPIGFFRENGTSLRALFGKDGGLGQSFQLAQLTIPDSAVIDYRGVFTVARGGTFVDLPGVAGQVGNIEGNVPPEIQPILRDITLGVNHGELANLQLVATDEFLPVDELVWSDLVVAGPGKNPSFPTATDPQLNSDGIFSWNPNGWRGGQYKFTATVADESESTTEVALTVNLTVPEPTSCVLMVGLSLGMLPAIRRRCVVG